MDADIGEPAPPPIVDSEDPVVSGEVPEGAPEAVDLPQLGEPSTPRSAKRPREEETSPLEPLEDVLLRRVTRIKEGDNVLLRLPSDAVKAVVASRKGLVQLGKFGGFPCSDLIGLHYDITYEIVPSGEGSTSDHAPRVEEGEFINDAKFGQGKGKKHKRQKQQQVGTSGNEGGEKTNPGWRNTLRPLRRQPLVDAVIEDITETNEFIDDTEATGRALLTQEEILELKAQGVSAEELIQKQIERHGDFELKTDFSKEKWRKRKERKFLQAIHPIAPSSANIVSHYLQRSPQSILYLREDTLSQLLTAANIRPGGRYLVVDDTGGLVTSAIMERMGCEGRVLTFTDADSPPAWGVLSSMNWGERELSCVKWLNWMEAEEDYERPPPPPEDDMPAVAAAKTVARMKRHQAQVNELNATRNELYTMPWDGLILSTELNPISVISRLTPYLAGSATITAYSPYMQILAEVLAWTKKDPNYLNQQLTESWSRTYQVLPGRTHPLMTTSATGGYLFSAIRVHPSKYQPESNQRIRQRKKHKSKQKAEEANGAELDGNLRSANGDNAGGSAATDDGEMEVAENVPTD